MLRVLLVDDDANFRKSLVIGLETSGYQIFEANSGMEALEFLQTSQLNNHQMDRVIVDARMPGLDGFLLCDQISAMYPSIGVIILTAHPYPDKTDKYTILTKPIHISKLTEILEQNISLSENQ